MSDLESVEHGPAHDEVEPIGDAQHGRYFQAGQLLFPLLPLTTTTTTTIIKSNRNETPRDVPSQFLDSVATVTY